MGRHTLQLQLLFLVTGFVDTLVKQYLHYAGIQQINIFLGAADSRSLLTVLATYIGMVLVVFLPAASHLPSSSSPTSIKQDDSLELLQISPRRPAAAKTPATASSSATPRAPPSTTSGVNHNGVALVSTMDLFGQVVLTVGLFLYMHMTSLIIQCWLRFVSGRILEYNRFLQY